jgi:hypothetical protein
MSYAASIDTTSNAVKVMLGFVKTRDVVREARKAREDTCAAMRTGGYEALQARLVSLVKGGGASRPAATSAPQHPRDASPAG